METWREVATTDYLVSSEGRVKHGGVILKPRHHTNGYLRITICRHGTTRDAYIHRLICAAFHGPAPAPHFHADHIDGNRANNRASNLRWLSPEANRALRFQQRPRARQRTLSPDQVIAIRKSPDAPAAELARQFNVAPAAISRIRSGKSWRHLNVSR